MDDFELEIKNEFINEALANLEETEESFMELEGHPDPKLLLDKIFRLAHNLKGGSRAVGFGEVAEFTHELETLVLQIQKGAIQLSGELVTTLLRSNDRLVEMLSKLKSDLGASTDTSDLLLEIREVLAGKSAPAKPTIVPSAEEIAAAYAEFTPMEEEVQVIEVPAPIAATHDKPVEHAHSEEEYIRVNLSRIDLLNDFVGELIVLQSVVLQQCASQNFVVLHSSLRQISKISKDIQSLSIGLRMLPVKPLVQKLQRVVRDTAKALGKDIQLELAGEHIEIDKSVLDQLSDPLIHIVRNAADHGVESKEDRQASGKSAHGTIRLTFRNEGNHLGIEITDDGKGIDAANIRRSAISKGLITENSNLTDKQLIYLIFNPGFSTKTVTSEISGRGVGMDVVKTNVEKIGGKVEVITEIGKGSSFRLKIPLSLAVIEGLVVNTEVNRYVIPLSQIQQTVNLGAEKVSHGLTGVGDCFELRGNVVPLFGLESLLDGKNKAIKPNGTALIVLLNERPMGVVVHDIVRAQQIVVKPLSNGIPAQKGWVGSCVLGDGLPTLILNPVELLNGKITYGGDVPQRGEVA